MTEFVIATLMTAVAVYGTSASTKLRSRRAYRSFRSGLASTSLVTGRRAAMAAPVLAAAEAAAACLAIAAAVGLAALPGAATAGRAALAGTALAAAALLTGVLAAGVAVILRRGTRASCNCFGAAAQRQLSATHLLRNTGLLAALLAGLAVSQLGLSRPAPAAVAVAAAAGIVAGLLIIRFDDLVELFAPSRTGTWAPR